MFAPSPPCKPVRLSPCTDMREIWRRVRVLQMSGRRPAWRRGRRRASGLKQGHAVSGEQAIVSGGMAHSTSHEPVRGEAYPAALPPGMENRRARGRQDTPSTRLNRQRNKELRPLAGNCLVSSRTPRRSGRDKRSIIGARSCAHRLSQDRHRTTHGVSDRAPLPRWGEERQQHGRRALVR